MYRRRILLGTPGSTPVVRVQRTTSIRLRPRVVNSKAGYATEIPPSASGTLPPPPPPPPPPRKKGFLRRTLLYTSIFAGTFYGGSTLVALKNERYHDFFVESVPGGEALVEFATEQGWDKVPLASIPQKAVDSAKDAYSRVQSTISGATSSSTPTKSDAPQPSLANRVGERAKRASSAIVTKVQRNPNAPDFSHVGQATSATVFKFSEGVSELAKEVESALRGTYKTSTDAKGTTKPTSPDAMPTRGVEAISEEDLPAWSPPKGKQLYTGPPLPLGFEPPPGYVLAPPPKPPKPSAEGAAPVLPSLASTLKPELSASEPVIAQLASTIDSLASFVQANPSALASAQGVITTAQIDLENLGKRLEVAKGEERAKLEKKMEEKVKEYENKLLGLEMDAKDKLDKQEEEWKGLFDEERAKIVAAYRAKLNAELETQSEIINQRLKEEVIAQGIELQRRWIREIKVRVESERGGRLAKLEELATGLKRLERTTQDNAAYIDESARVHGMWSALRAVCGAALDAPKRTPFRDELRVLRGLAADVSTEGEAGGDKPEGGKVLSTVLDTLLASSAPDEGIEPRADLAAWFTTSVAPAVRRAALVPDTSAGVLSHLASNIFAAFRFSRPTYAPNLSEGGKDVLSVIARAEYLLGLKDLDGAAREVNQLTGWPARLVRDWMDAVRRRLEVEQALEAVQTQATLSSLLVV